MDAPRSMLFVSGEKPARFDKALASGADMICVDLEDAVHPARRGEARQAVIAWLKVRSSASFARPCPVAVRINGVQTRDGLNDLVALLEHECRPDVLLLPKIEQARDIELVRAWFGPGCPQIVALIETPFGIEQMGAIAANVAHTPNLVALMLGGADLAAELGAGFGWRGLRSARGRLVNAAKAYRLQAWDVPHIDLAKPAELEEETRRILELGFDCKTAIHPDQLPIIHRAFAPSSAELAWARGLMSAADGVRTGAFLHKGRLVDEPVLRHARRIVLNASRDEGKRLTPVITSLGSRGAKDG